MMRSQCRNKRGEFSQKTRQEGESFPNIHDAKVMGDVK